MMIMEAIGLRLKDFKQEMMPIITSVKRKSSVLPNDDVCGVDMR